MKKLVALVVFAPMLFVTTSYSMDTKMSALFVKTSDGSLDIQESAKKLKEDHKKTLDAFKDLGTHIFVNKSLQQQLQQVESAIKRGKLLKEKYETIIGGALLERGSRTEDQTQGLKSIFDHLSDLQNAVASLHNIQGKMQRDVERSGKLSIECTIL